MMLFDQLPLENYCRVNPGVAIDYVVGQKAPAGEGGRQTQQGWDHRKIQILR